MALWQTPSTDPASSLAVPESPKRRRFKPINHSGEKSMSRRTWLAPALVVVAVISAGCGSSTPTATSTGSGSGITGSTSTNLAGQEKAVKFAECMRSNGVPHFPDPDTKGAFNFGVDVTPAVFTKAVDSCKALEPPGALSSKRTLKQQAASLRFAQCVREHGVKDFPDPANGQPMIDTTKIPSSNRPGGMTILNAATHQCGSILELSAGGQG